MRLVARFQSFLQHNRRKHALKDKRSDLREFVYLDEVSVYSLIASRLGSIATEFTENQARTLQGEITGSAGVDVGIAKGEFSSHVLESKTLGSQILRKSIIQSQFKELYESEKDLLAIRPTVDFKPPEIRSLDELIQVAKTANSNNWIINSRDLSRGQLLEIEVQLEAESIFRVSAVVSALLDILDENPEMFGLDNYESLLQAKTIDRLLEKLLFGLIPVRGEAIDYKVVELDRNAWVVHTSLLDQLAGKDSLLIHPLFVVGVAEQSLFWKDIRRILFAKARYRVFCRIAHDGIQTSWTPVKLVQVLETVAPDLAKQIDAVDLNVFNAMAQTNNKVNRETKALQHVNDALMVYANLLAKHYDYNISEQNISEIKLLAVQFVASFNTQRGRRDAFETVADLILKYTDKERDPSIVSMYRAVALKEVGLDFLGNPTPIDTKISPLTESSSTDRFIDTEIVAIYW